MKIIHVETLISSGAYPISEHWIKTRKLLHEAIERIEWPVGQGKFIIYPESGKKRGKGNGVTPIKNGLIEHLRTQGWKSEEPLNIAARKKPGKIDAVLYHDYGATALEWETGNISSSHRALNKMCLGLMKGVLISGTFVVPSKELAQFLTDRVGNWEELVPYMELWKSIICENGVLEVVVVEHDGTSMDVPKIPKGTDGRAIA
jgi:restriction endonuclease BamHI